MLARRTAWPLLLPAVAALGCLGTLWAWHWTAAATGPLGLRSGTQERRAAAQLDADLFSQLPPSGFLPGFKTPCWRHQPAKPDYAGRNDQGPGPASNQEQQQQQQQEQASQQQLRCLPYFFVLGGFQSGSYSLYSMLQAHPEVARGHNPRPHFWAEFDKPFSSYMSELHGASDFISSKPGTAVLGDASESTFAFYMSAGMRGHRMWATTLRPCQQRCSRLQEPFLQRCLDVCWRNATRADAKHAHSLGVRNRLMLDTPFFIKAVYDAAADSRGAHRQVPKLVVLLRNPTQRLYSSFLQYDHYRQRYGDGLPGFQGFLKEQLAAFDACLHAHHSVEECTLQFEALDYANEKVFFHCDQVLRGLYWVYLQSWMAHFGPQQLLVILSEELFAHPAAVLKSAVEFLQLEQRQLPEELWQQMLRADEHPASRTAGQPLPQEIKALVDRFYEPHNKRLGLLLHGQEVSPWQS